jgi:NTE family protein
MRRKARGGSWLLVTILVTIGGPRLVMAECAASRMARDAPTALVFSGGGAKGAYEAGVALALHAAGVSIRVAAGSSAGALNAAMVVDGRMDRLEALWRSLTRDQVYRLRPLLLLSGLLPGYLTLLAMDQGGSMLDAAPLRESIAGAVDFERLRASPVALRVIAADLARREAHVFDNRSVSLDVLMAASSVPGVFPPVAVNGTLLVDGGLVGRAPIIEALAAGEASRAVVVMSYAPQERGRPPTTLRTALEEAFETAMIHQIRRDAELARLKHPGVEIQLVVPSAPLLLRPLDFEPAGIARAMEQGRADGQACVRRWQD